MTKQDQVFARCARRLIPLMGLLYFANFIDRVNVGFAALTMNKDLGFSPTVFGFGAGVFFFGYFLFPGACQCDPRTGRCAALDILHHGDMGFDLGGECVCAKPAKFLRA